MIRSAFSTPVFIIALLLAVGLVVGAACGGDDPTPVPTNTQAPQPTDTPEPTAMMEATSVPAPQATDAPATRAPTPTAAPRPTATPVAMPEGGPEGTLSIGFKELGPFRAHPALAGYPLTSILTSGFGEGLIEIDADGQYTPMLATEWEVASDNQTWTYKLQKGV